MSKITSPGRVISSGSGTADGDPVEAQGRLADADRNTLALLAARPDARIECEVIADHRHAMHGFGPVADERGTLDRRGHLAVLDAIGFCAGEDEFPRCDVDLAAAEGDGEEPVLD